MLPEIFTHIVIWFALYSFIGWVCEFTFSVIVNNEVIDPGFLNLPIVPIYGFGALFSIYGLLPWQDNPYLVFLLGVVGMTILEFITSFLLEKLFNKQLWSYESMPLHIQGRVCLPMSVLFGILVLVVVYVVHPEVATMTDALDFRVKAWISVLFLALFVLDLILSVSAVVSLRRDTSYKKTRAIVERLAILDARWDAMRDQKRRGNAVRINRLINRINRRILFRLGTSFPVLKQR